MTTEPDWPTCEAPGEPCPGIRVEGFRLCLAHLNPDHLSLFLSRLGPGANLDSRGTTISDDLLARLLDAVRRDGEDPLFGDVDFTKARFTGQVRFDRVSFGLAVLMGAEFENAEELGPLSADTFDLDGARFVRSVQIHAHDSVVSCVGTRFEDGVTMRMRNVDIDAARAIFVSPSSISRCQDDVLQRSRNRDWLRMWIMSGGNPGKPMLRSLRGADVSNLVLIDVDLSWCLFAGAHRLDQLRFQGHCRFNNPLIDYLSTWREVLAEEYLLDSRAADHPFLTDTEWIAPDRVAALYRSLRKAFEDSKNEPGAGDFYYGEMEMRRRSQATSSTERWILAAYRLLSGYGQRAWRAIAALVALIVTVTVLLLTVGLPGEHLLTWPRVDQSVRIAMGAVVFRDAGQQLTSAGSWTVMTARFLGPVLLALAVLAIRARVKR